MGNIKMIVAHNIKKFREQKGLTQKELAEKMGLKHNAISAWETGQNSIDIERLIQICAILDVDLNEMYGANIQKEKILTQTGEEKEILLALRGKKISKEKILKIIELLDNQD